MKPDFGIAVRDAIRRTASLEATNAEAIAVRDRFEPALWARIEFPGDGIPSLLISIDRPFALELASGYLGRAANEIDLERDGRDALDALALALGRALGAAGLAPAADAVVARFLELGDDDGLLCAAWLPPAA